MDEKSLLIQNNFVLTALFFFKVVTHPLLQPTIVTGGEGWELNTNLPTSGCQNGCSKKKYTAQIVITSKPQMIGQ